MLLCIHCLHYTEKYSSFCDISPTKCIIISQFINLEIHLLQTQHNLSSVKSLDNYAYLFDFFPCWVLTTYVAN